MGVAAGAASAHAVVSPAVTVDSRDYTLRVASAQSVATPAVGTHVYAWGTSLTCSVVVDSPTHAFLGWTGTGSIPASGTSSTTGTVILDDVDGSTASSITWNWYASPGVAADAYVALRNTALTILAPGVLANDSVDSGDSLRAIVVTEPAHGILSLAADGGFTYTPNEQFAGEDTFTYTAHDGVEESAATTVTISVTGGAVYHVTTTADSGLGSLRAAIEYANAHPWTQIVFTIPLTDQGYANGVFTLQPLTPLPVLAAISASIHGETQAAFSGDTNPLGPEIVLNGALAGEAASGIEIAGMGNLLRGIVINGFARYGVIAGTVESWGQHRVERCYVGTDSSGTTGVPNVTSAALLAGIRIAGGVGTVIGGTVPGAGNLVSGNGTDSVLADGIQIYGSTARANRIEGNWIGTDRSGTAALPNSRAGVLLYTCGADNLLGGAEAGARNLVSGNTTHGVIVCNPYGSGNRISGNYIGTDIHGAAALGNAQCGISVWKPTSGIMIGGAAPGQRNIISGNLREGISLSGVTVANNVISGNYIGTDITGGTALPNGLGQPGSGAILVEDSPGNHIGGTQPGEGNLIAGNGTVDQPLSGIVVSGSAAANNLIQGNRIGTTADGEHALPNSRHGIEFKSVGSGNRVGGSDAVAGNLVSGNLEHGVFVDGAGGGVAVQGNCLGTDASGTLPLANGASGVCIAASSDNQIGGEEAALGNRIAFNGGAGIRVESGSRNTFRGNSIFANAGVGIELAAGANGGVSAPTIDSLTWTGTETLIGGRVAAGTLPPAMVEVFSSLVADPSGFGEGETLRGVAVASDGAWILAVDADIPAASVLSATATDGAGNTSGFSAALDQQHPTVAFQEATSTWLEVQGHAGLLVVLSAPTLLPVQVSYSTGDGTAVAGSDYMATSGTLVFHPGERAKWVLVPLTEDTEAEGEEIFAVTLFAAHNASLGEVFGHAVHIQDANASYEYLVIDLASGPDSSAYPVSGLASVPDGGWSMDEQTTRLVLRRVSRGAFSMGAPVDERGRTAGEWLHPVALTEPFYLGVFEVTQRQWNLVMGDWPSHFSERTSRDSRPVEQVSWEEIRGGAWPGEPPGNGQPGAGTFLQRLRERSGIAVDLPTEAQWEYACRAGTTTALHSGKDLVDVLECPNLGEICRYAFNHPGGYSASCFAGPDSGSATVGSYLPNSWGIYDMHGNVREWCLDWQGSWAEFAIDPVGMPTGSYRAARGGGWTAVAATCRSACNAEQCAPGVSSYDLGFRVAAVGVAPAAAAHVVLFEPGRHGVHVGGGDLLQVVGHGAAATAPELGVAAGWRFVGWSTGFGEVTSDLHVVARYDVGLQPGDDFVLLSAGANIGMDPDNGLYSLAVGMVYMGTCEIPKSRWDPVRSWGVQHGYDDLPEGHAKSENHPVHSISWHDAVKWCNARSEMEGRTPCYTVSGAVYRTGMDDGAACDVAAGGYRLPTDSEWEYAGRSGLSGKRFPWGDTIDHDQANYWSDPQYAYDISLTRGHHPDHLWGIPPYTAPVGAFAENGYGLHDMAGNVAEWCTDWHPAYIGLRRVARGGSWNEEAPFCRVGARGSLEPVVRTATVGFRVCTVAPVQHTVTFELGERGVRIGGGELQQRVLPGHAAVAPDVAAAEGWFIAAWSASFAAVTEDLLVTALYERIRCVVLFRLGEHGTHTGGGDLVQQVIYGQAAAAPAFAVDDGWTFVGWNGAFDQVTGDLEIAALYAPTVYALTVVGGDGDGSYEAGTVIPIQAEAAPVGHIFAGWTAQPADHAGNLANPIWLETTFTMPPADVVLSAAYIPIGQDPLGTPTDYPATGMTVLIRVTRLAGEAQAGDVVGAFVQGELRGKVTVVVVDGVAYANLTVAVGENGETISFRLWCAASGHIEAGDATLAAEAGTGIGTPTLPFAVCFSPIDSLSISLAPGWNHVSLPLRAVEPTCAATFAPIADTLQKVIGGTRNYTPGWGELNTLVTLEDGLGYWIQVSSAVTWTVCGPPLQAADTPIELLAGWNDIAFIGPSTSSIDGALAGIMGALEKVVGSGGNYTPGWGAINSLTEMRRGDGYWVKVSFPITLTYGFAVPSTGRETASPKRRAVPDWYPEQPDPPATAHTILARVTLDDAPVAPGSRLGVFVNGQCRATGEPMSFQGQTFFNLTVLMGSSDDVAEFRLYDAFADAIRETAASLDLAPGAADGTPEAPLEIAFYTPVAQHSVIFRPGLHGTLDGGSPDVVAVVEAGADPPLPPTVSAEEGWLHVGWDWQVAGRGDAPVTIYEDWVVTALYEEDVLPPLWAVTLNVTGGAPATLTVGMHVSAAAGWVEGLDVLGPELPLLPGQAGIVAEDLSRCFAARFLVPAAAAEWLLLVHAGAMPVTVFWGAPSIPAGKHMSLYEVRLEGVNAGRPTGERALIGCTAVQMTGEGRLEVLPGESRSFVIRYGDEAVFDLPLAVGWNLVSLPIEPLDPRVESLFDNQPGRYAGAELHNAHRGTLHSGAAWAWEGQRYHEIHELHACMGYWLYADRSAVLLIEGMPVYQEHLVLRKGWNLWGPTKAVPLPDDARICGTAWTWHGPSQGYQDTLRLWPGLGYWLNAGDAASIPLGEER